MISLKQTVANLILASALVSSATLGAVRNSEPEMLFAGLFINDEEKDGADLYSQDDTYWLPLRQLLDWANVQAETKNNKTVITTPLGDADIPASALREMPDGMHVDIAALADAGIKARFDQNAYALVIYAPWIGIKPATAALANSPQTPDYIPPQAGVSRIYNRLDTNYSDGNSNTGLYSDAMGYLVNGVWGLQTATDDQQTTQLSQLYWHTFDRYMVFRLGTAKANPGPLLEAPDYAGIQLGYSNLSVYNHLAATSSVSRQLFVDDASYSHDISGSGPKGGIAELRLNDRPIARVRIALDGKFLFTRLPITQGNTDRVEVALYEYSLAQPPTRIIDYTTASKPRSVSTGELMLNGGIGALGSSLETSVDNGNTTSYGSLRYGLSNFLTLEAATQQQQDRENGWYLGFIASITGNLATSLGAARTGDTDNVGAEIWGNWPKVKASYRGNREIDTITDENNENHELSIRWDVTNNFSLVTRGLTKSVDDITEEEYLAPGFDWKITPYSTLSLQPVDGKDYDARLSLRSDQNDVNLQLRSSKDGYGIGTQYAINNAFSLAADYSMRDEQRVISSAASYRPRHNNDSIYSAQISQQDQQLGYSLGWRHRLSPRTQFNFTYYRQLSSESALLEDLETNSDESVSLSVESELWTSPRGWRTYGMKTDSTHGAVSARVRDAQGNLLDNKNIRLQVEEAGSTLKPGKDGEQSLAGLPPGDYNLKLLADGLPIEYENSASNFRIRVAPAATTNVEITLKAHYGASGLLTVNGNPAPYTWVDVWQKDKRIAESKTDGYGYYQVTALLPGEYELRHGETIIPFQVSDDYLFDINIASASDDIPLASALTVPEQATPDVLPEMPETLFELGTKLPPGLSGRVFYEDEPLGHVSVELKLAGRKIATVISDSYGYYSFHHLSKGEYQVNAGSTVATYKVLGLRTYDADIHLDKESVANKQWFKP